MVEALRGAPTASRLGLDRVSLERGRELVSRVVAKVSVGVLLTSLWLFFFFCLQLKHRHTNSSKSGSICSHLFYWSELFPSFPWLLTQPARATCKPLHREWMRVRASEGGRKGVGVVMREKDGPSEREMGICREDDQKMEWRRDEEEEADEER